jgi:hypothetical protein
MSGRSARSAPDDLFERAPVAAIESNADVRNVPDALASGESAIAPANAGTSDLVPG